MSSSKTGAARIAPVAPQTPPALEALAADIARLAIEVTPAMALAALEHPKAPRNRPLDGARVRRYAAMMRSGMWFLTHQGIGLGPEGEMLDGQHRLRAVVLAGVPVKFVVIRGIAVEARGSMDAGKARATSQQLHMLSEESYATAKAAWANVWNRLINNSRVPLTYPEVVAWLDANREAAEWAVTLYSHAEKRTPLTRAVVLGPLVFAYPTDPEGVRAFGEQVVVGAGLTESDPAYVLRNYLIGAPADNAQASREIAMKVLRACQLALKGERFTKLQYSEMGLKHFARAHGAPAAP